MLWSDPEEEPPEQMREAQAMLRRLGLVLALAMVLAMFVAGLP
ncbi:morphogenic membrane protein MmpB [Streptomyces sp. NPDC006879]